MTITGCLILILWLGLIPLAVGAIPAVFVDKKQQNLGFMWTTGYMLLWAVFQVLCVGLILTEEVTMLGVLEPHFPYVVTAFCITGAVLAVAGVILWCIHCKKQGKIFDFPKWELPKSKKEYFLWGIFLLLLAIQLVNAVVLRYGDGDDAFYVAVSTITESNDTLYKVQPYSMGSTGLSTRHSLAPFPVWIAFLARISGCHTAAVAHVAVSVTLIFMTYVIYGQIGKLLCREKGENLPIFLSFVALLVLFGDYSIYTPETFMLARSRQGKAALGNIIIPMVILLFLLLFDRIREGQKCEWMLWILLTAVVTSACLCSTLGTFLMCLFLGVIGLCAGGVYKRFELVWKTALCCAPALVYAALYFVLV